MTIVIRHCSLCKKAFDLKDMNRASLYTTHGIFIKTIRLCYKCTFDLSSVMIEDTET